MLNPLVGVIIDQFAFSVAGFEGMSSFTRFVRSLKWTPLPVGVGFAVLAATQYRHIRRREVSQSVCLSQFKFDLLVIVQ